MTTDSEYVEAALQAWATTFPRRVTMLQRWATSLPEAVELILDAENDSENWPFISTYSFPNGHTSNNKVPRIDRLFFDFDVPEDSDYRSGNGGKTEWARDMSRLLVRTRKVAQFLLNGEDPDCWQASLSGSKGVHLDLVFPRVHDANGSFQQFKAGMASYADSIIEYLSDATGLDDLEVYVDVDSSDLGRLRRVPNTKHYGASQFFGEDRFCVPVTLAELAEIGPTEYIELTRSRRPVTVTMKATPNEKAGEILTQRIRTIDVVSGSNYSTSTVDGDRIEGYLERQNERISVDDIPFILTDRPCVAEFIKRDDAFDHHSSSHMMELFVITNMMDKGVPIEIEYDEHDHPRVTGGTMVDFFAQHKDFDKKYTCGRIEEYISRAYKPVSCEKIWAQAELFCLKSDCGIYHRANTNR